MNTDTDTLTARDGWNSYWQGAGAASAYSADGNVHPSIGGFWSEFFRSSKTHFDAPRIVDLASGNGALVQFVFDTLGQDAADITCVDASEKAIDSIRERYPAVSAIVADAADTELPAGAFDIVTSQFGVEYAGKSAIEEAVRLLAGNGRLALLLHHTESPIHEDCEAGLDAVSRVRESRFVPLARDFLGAGFDAVRGADRAPYEQAATLLNPAIRTVESVVEDHGPDVAGGVVANLYETVKRMHQRIQHYEPAEVLGWLQDMERQLEDYVARMSTMHAAALDESAFDGICEVVTGAGCAIVESGPLFAPGEQRPLAWALLASR
jgi:SAM-dependent methyltransferase